MTVAATVNRVSAGISPSLTVVVAAGWVMMEMIGTDLGCTVTVTVDVCNGTARPALTLQ